MPSGYRETNIAIRIHRAAASPGAHSLMCCRVEPDLLEVWALLCVHPTPILPWSQHKTKSSYDCVAGQQEREAAKEESGEGIYGSAGEPCAELCPVLTAVTSHQEQPHSVLDRTPFHSQLKDQQTKVQGRPCLDYDHTAHTIQTQWSAFSCYIQSSIPDPYKWEAPIIYSKDALTRASSSRFICVPSVSAQRPPPCCHIKSNRFSNFLLLSLGAPTHSPGGWQRWPWQFVPQ